VAAALRAATGARVTGALSEPVLEGFLEQVIVGALDQDAHELAREAAKAYSRCGWEVRYLIVRRRLDARGAPREL
jgi:hypothetical protein